MAWHFTVTADNHDDALRAFKVKAAETPNIPTPHALSEAAQGLLWAARAELSVSITSCGYFDSSGQGYATVTVNTVIPAPAVDPAVAQ